MGLALMSPLLIMATKAKPTANLCSLLIVTPCSGYLHMFFILRLDLVSSHRSSSTLFAATWKPSSGPSPALQDAGDRLVMELALD
jgi:hypothetical protein